MRYLLLWTLIHFRKSSCIPICLTKEKKTNTANQSGSLSLWCSCCCLLHRVWPRGTGDGRGNTYSQARIDFESHLKNAIRNTAPLFLRLRWDSKLTQRMGVGKTRRRLILVLRDWMSAKNPCLSILSKIQLFPVSANFRRWRVWLLRKESKRAW